MMMTTSTSAVQAENKLELKISMSLTCDNPCNYHGANDYRFIHCIVIKVLHSVQKIKIVVNIVLSKFINNCIDTTYSFSNPFEI